MQTYSLTAHYWGGKRDRTVTHTASLHCCFRYNSLLGHTNLANCSLLEWEAVLLQHGFSYNSFCACKPTAHHWSGGRPNSNTDCVIVPQFQLQDVSLCLSFSYKMCHCASVSVTRCVIVPQFQLQDVSLCLSFNYKMCHCASVSVTRCVIVPQFQLQQTDFISSCIKTYPTAHYWGQKRDQTVSLCHGFTYNKQSSCIQTYPTTHYWS